MKTSAPTEEKPDDDDNLRGSRHEASKPHAEKHAETEIPMLGMLYACLGLGLFSCVGLFCVDRFQQASFAKAQEREMGLRVSSE